MTMIMEENVRICRDKSDLLQKEMKPFTHLRHIERLIPQWENSNTDDMENTTDRLLESQTGRFSRVINELIKDIRKDYKKGGGDQSFSCFLAFSEGVVYLYFLVRPAPYERGAVLGTAVHSWLNELHFPS